MKYFTFDELTYSRTAVENGLLNRPGATERDNLAQLVERLLDPLRERLGEPIAILSGYRSPEVNTLVGGVTDSQRDGRSRRISPPLVFVVARGQKTGA